ncbi:MAG: oligosaccharide flippase family protein [Nitrospira sp.]|nr:oligosaccharide flippase family protein [Nitrospira sp.]
MDRLSLKLKRLSANTIVANCLWMFGGGVGRTVTALGSNLVLMWYVLPEEFGRFALVQATIGLVAGTANFKIRNIIIRASSQELETGGKDFLFSALVIESVLLGLGTLCLLWGGGLWDLWAGVLLFGTIATHWGIVMFAYYERSFHYRNLALLESCAYMLSYVLTSVAAILGIGYPVLYVRILIEAIGIFSGLVFVGGMVTFRLRWLFLHDWKTLYCRFRGMWLDGWLEHFFERLVILMVGWMAGEKTAGCFFQARRLAGVPQILMVPVTEKLAYNYFSHRVAADRGLHILGQTLAVQLGFLVVVGVAVYFVASPLIPMLFGVQWEPVVPLLQAMTGVVLGLSPFGTLKAFCMARNRMRPFVLLGRGVQYGALAGAALAILVYHVPAALTLAVSLSAGYVLGGLALFVFRRGLL